MTRREFILKIMSDSPFSTFTCGELCDRIIMAEQINRNSNQARYLSGSISSLLVKMCNDKQIKIVSHAGPRGGKCYSI